MRPDPFANVPLNEDIDTACSPAEPTDLRWTGIVINAPARAYLPGHEPVPDDQVAFGRIPVCGYGLVELLKIEEGVPMRLVAVDSHTGKRFDGPIVEPLLDHEVPAPEPDWEGREVDLTGQAVGGYFNPNLNDFVQLPAVPATYEVFILHGAYESNHVTIEVVPWDSARP